MAHDHGQPGRHAGRQFLDGPIAGGNKPFPQQQILGRIAAHDEFGGDQNVRPGLPGLAGGGNAPIRNCPPGPRPSD